MACLQNRPAASGVRASGQWCVYYRANLQALLRLPWERGAELTEAERDTIAASLQKFQLGEQSEGRHLERRARDHADLTGDADYWEAIRLFLKEEQRHARELGRFLTLAGVPLLERTWTDSVFRRLRRLAGLELCITVLVTAELIGKVYYQALRRATASPLLRRICDQLLRDEVQHIRFHLEHLARLRSERSVWRRLWARGWHRLLYGGTCLVVWWQHSKVLRAGGYGMRRFWRACWDGLNAESRRARRPVGPPQGRRAQEMVLEAH
jgi:hypothetical protein